MSMSMLGYSQCNRGSGDLFFQGLVTQMDCIACGTGSPLAPITALAELHSMKLGPMQPKRPVVPVGPVVCCCPFTKPETGALTADD